jgi:predicted RNA-binding protein YlxR (DUF448 family)
LLRVAAVAQTVRADPRGVAPGRGAYVHRHRGCIEEALKRGAFARALRVAIQPGEVSNLLQEIEEDQ